MIFHYTTLIFDSDITIEFAGKRPDTELELKISADVEKKYIIGKSKEKIIRRNSNEIM